LLSIPLLWIEVVFSGHFIALFIDMLRSHLLWAGESQGYGPGAGCDLYARTRRRA
jgi:hypothetical protein